MGDGRNRIWIEMTPLETFVSLALMMTLLGIAFGVGMHYGETLSLEEHRPAAVMQKQTMAEIEQYIKDHKSSFHFQKALDVSDSESQAYLYTIDTDDSAGGRLKRLVRVAAPKAEPEPDVPVETGIAVELDAEMMAPFAEESGPVAELVPSLQSAPSPQPALVLPALGAVAAASGYVIQVETFDNERRAQTRQAVLLEKGYQSFIDTRLQDTSLPYRLYVGPYPTKEAAKSVLDALRALTRPDAFVRYYDAQQAP